MITANVSNWGSVYSQSWWGNATTTSKWGSIYLVSYLMSDLRRRASTYENNIMTIQLLNDINDCDE